MHFAYPPRKTSNPPPYQPRAAINFSVPSLRRNRLKAIALAGLAFITLIWLLTRSRGSSGPHVERKPSGKPPVVIVTTLDESKFTKAFTQTIKENRVQYAARHGYETYFPKVDEYDLKGAPASWAKVVAMRHAMTLFPDAAYFWFLDHDSFVMNPLLRIEEHVMKPARLESLMMKDHPVVPPDSIIKTFGHLKGQDVDFVLTQDKDGLSVSSFIIRNGEWALFFFETWFDPIYRSYNFQKAEAHALEHIVQWHPTILSKLALIPQRIINSYNKDGKGEAYKDGDIAIRFPDCTKSSAKDCETETNRFAQQWKASFQNA